MKTYGYLLNDETNPPKLWEIFHHPDWDRWGLEVEAWHSTTEDDGLVTFNDPQDPSNWGWTLKSNVWEICTF